MCDRYHTDISGGQFFFSTRSGVDSLVGRILVVVDAVTTTVGGIWNGVDGRQWRKWRTVGTLVLDEGVDFSHLGSFTLSRVQKGQ